MISILEKLKLEPVGFAVVKINNLNKISVWAIHDQLKSSEQVEILGFAKELHLAELIRDKILFDRTIAAWKVRGIIYEKCRTTHNKTPKDLINCGKLSKNCKIVFFDDQTHQDMFNNNIFYRPLDGYRRDILFENMITRFLNSKLAHIIKKNKLKYFKSFILKIVRYSPSGFRYVEKPYKSKIHPKNIANFKARPWASKKTREK